MADKKASKDAKAPKGGPPSAYSLKAHPKAQRHIAGARAWAALAAFALTAWLSLQAGVAPADAVLRAVGFGFAAQLLVWGLMVLVWRQLAAAEIENLRRELENRVRQADEPGGRAA